MKFSKKVVKMGEKKKKMSLLACIAMGLGCIIGAGIFAITPVAVKIVGNGVVWGFLLAAVFLLFKTLPEFIISSSIPANGGAYMGLSRLIHPIMGCFQTFNDLVIGVMKIATLSLTFATYTAILFPVIAESAFGTASVAILITVIFTAISLKGIKVSVWVQNISVLTLLVALGIYIFGGFTKIKIDPMDVIVPTIKITKLWAVMGMLHGSLIGANALIYMADEIDEPRKNIPKAFIFSTLVCALVFALMSYITVGVIPVDTMGERGPVIYSDAYSLGLVAEQFMSKPMLIFFITGGALIAVITSLNAVILMFSRGQFVAARDGLYPKIVAKMNVHNVPVGAVLLNTIIAVIAIASGYNLDDVVKITTIPGLLLSPILYLSIFVLPKKYPLCYKNNFFKIPHKVTIALVIFASILCFLLGGSMVMNMKPKHYGAMIVFYAIAALYVVIRKNWLKKNKGIELFEQMRKPHEPWNKMEEEFALKERAVT
ncbi:MAG: APC family permease [Spirochaetales bacterium]|nr:APC family permease [Spirochaetales bacterium]